MAGTRNFLEFLLVGETIEQLFARCLCLWSHAAIVIFFVVSGIITF